MEGPGICPDLFCATNKCHKAPESWAKHRPAQFSASLGYPHPMFMGLTFVTAGDTFCAHADVRSDLRKGPVRHRARPEIAEGGPKDAAG